MRINSSGFTLIEMLVAVSLFTVVTVVGLGIVADSYRSARVERDSVGRLFAVERAMDIMVRELQSGYSYDCDGGGDCSAGADNLSFLNSEDVPVTYSYDNSGSAPILVRTVDGVDADLVTADSATSLDLVRFYVEGTSLTDLEQPRVRILMSGDINDNSDSVTPFNLDMFISQRRIDG